MTGSERNTRAHGTDNASERTKRIRDLNDAVRRAGIGGMICVSAGVQALGGQGVATVLLALFDFDAFDGDNDPHGEHDFGAFEIEGERLFWKIDYYDRDRIYGSPDPADPTVTTRVLTIMLASEY